MTSHPIQNVCVYCGSQFGDSPVFREAAIATGKAIAQHGWTMVFGGGSVGLMGTTANAAMDAGGKVIGVIPEYILHREKRHDGLTELHVVSSMHERKQMMVEHSDSFLILPGGLGTLDEFLEILVWKQLKMHDKPIVIVNISGYWDSLIETIHTTARHGFMFSEDLSIFKVAQTVDDAIKILAEAKSGAIEPHTDLL